MDFVLKAQTVTLILQSVDSAFVQERKEMKSVGDALDFVHKWQAKVLEEGYLAASIDEIQSSHDTLTALLFTGQQYRWANLSFANTPPLLWQALRLPAQNWTSQNIAPKKFSRLTQKMLTYYENNGHPFATVFLDSIQAKDEGISAQLKIEPGPFIHIDSIVLVGGLEISLQFLSNHIGIRQGDVYNESKLKMLSKKLKELPFLEQYQAWKLDFTIDQNKLYLYLKDKKANQLNGLIGLQPNNSETGGFLITADFLLGLKNSLGYGESLDVVYQNLQYKSPRFNAQFQLPYVLGTPFGLEAAFDLYKKDTSYRKTSLTVGARYHLNENDVLNLNYINLSNRLITTDTAYVRREKKLPENLDIQSHGLGLSLEMNRTDYQFNPKKGWTFKLSTSALLRSILMNDAILELKDASGFNYQNLYNEANSEKYQYRFHGNLGFFFPVLKNFITHLSYQGGYISGKRLFQNELFQLGGFQRLRGFDEHSIYARQYHLATVEFRFLFGENSYFYLFSDNAYVHTEFGNINKHDYPISFGTGLTLENKGGILKVALGVGKFSGEQFEFKKARVHFGYALYF